MTSFECSGIGWIYICFVVMQLVSACCALNSRLLLVNLEKLGFSQKLFFPYFKWNSGGSGVSRRTAPTIRSYLQSFSRFGGTWYQKVHFSTFDGKLTSQCTRNGPQNPPFCPGSLQDTFIIYSSISHQPIFQKNL